MKRLQNLGKSLTKAEQKKINGGLMMLGQCVMVYSTQGYSSCWYTNDDPLALCHRVYGSNCESVIPNVDCQENGCIMQS